MTIIHRKQYFPSGKTLLYFTDQFHIKLTCSNMFVNIFFLGNFANRAMPFSWKGALVSTSGTCCLQKLVIYVLINLRRHKYIFLFQKLYNSNMWYHVMLNQHLATETSFVLNIYFTFRPWIFRTCSYTHIFFY